VKGHHVPDPATRAERLRGRAATIIEEFISQALRTDVKG
jgi:hypothetical protein